MPTQTNEQALESAIEKRLTGVSTEDFKASGASNSFSDHADVCIGGKGYFWFNGRFLN